MKKLIIVIMVAFLVASCVGQVDGQKCIGEDCVEAICNDNIDNDEDGKTDCADSDCSDAPECQSSNNQNNVTNETICDDGVDNDSDGRTDCADSDCSDDSACQSSNNINNVTTETICDDGIDNDDDGKIDCEDSDCDSNPICNDDPVEDCANDIDDDGDGLTDCLDKDCENASNCIHVDAERLCGDNMSNDIDGGYSYVDCDDHDCVTSIECTGRPKFSDGIAMFPGEGTDGGGCMNTIGSNPWTPTCFGDAVVTGNYYILRRDAEGNLVYDTKGDPIKDYAAAYGGSQGCTAAAIRAHGIRYSFFQIGILDAPGGDYITPDAVCHAHCGHDWNGDDAQVNISCMYSAQVGSIFESFDEEMDHRDETVLLDMSRVIFRRPAEK